MSTNKYHMLTPSVWFTGLNNYKKHTFDSNIFNTEILDQDFEYGRPLDVMIYDSVKAQSNSVEVLYSGGIDSELILQSLIRHNLPVTAITMVIKIRDCIVNTHDLYYAEKFCRQNNVRQEFYTLEAEHFFKSGEYENYLIPYNITQPHVASHFWLIERCVNFPVFGGDWPWVLSRYENKKLSPFKIDYSCHELFMQNKNITGIGNMLSNTYELAYTLSKKQMLSPFNVLGNFNEINILKQDMFSTTLEPRTKSYGWERFPKHIFDIRHYHDELVKKVGEIKNTITWGEKYKLLINSTVNTNDIFYE